MMDLIPDLRFAVRSLRRQPGFAAAAILTMALGIGATTAIFSLVHGILLQPLPYPDPERIVSVWPDRWFSKPLFELLEEHATSFEALAGWSAKAHILLDDDGAHWLPSPRVTAGFFDVLGRDVALGRTFAEGDDRRGGDAVVISDGLWKGRFGGDPRIIGRSVRFTRGARTIVGVMRPGFDFLQQDGELAMTQLMEPEAPGYGFGELHVIGRLKPGIGVEQAAAELQTLVQGWREEYGASSDWGLDATVVPLREHLVGETRPMLVLLLAGVALTLLIATANVAHLLLARSLSRRREMGLRLALGAGPGRVVRQLMTESTLLGLLGAVPGFTAALFGVDALRHLLPPETPRLDQVQVDSSMLAFAVVVALGTGWLVGLVPAFQAARIDLQQSLRSGGRSGTDTRYDRRLRSATVVSEIALAVTLLAASALLVRSFMEVAGVDPGLRAKDLVKLSVSPDRERLRGFADVERYFARVDERLEAVPGVRAAAAIWQAPLSPDGGISGFYAADDPPGTGEEPPRARWRPVSPDYFRVAGIPVLRGRPLERSDAAGREGVAVISQAGAELLFPGVDPLGQRVAIGIEGGAEVRVVGVVGDVRALGLDQPSPLMIYRPYAQVQETVDKIGAYQRELVVRMVAEPGSLGTIRQAVLSVDRYAVVRDLRSMRQAIAASMGLRRVTMLLIACFSAAALILAAIGTYGVIAYDVGARAKEIGIRVVLGASRRQITRRVLLDGIRLAAVGTGLGLVLTFAASGALRPFLYRVEPGDPVALGGAVVAVLALAFASTLLPARSAGNTDPRKVLADE